MRNSRQVNEREIAMAIMMAFAEGRYVTFSMLGFYDDDAEFIEDVAERVQCKADNQFKNKMTRVVRRMVNAGVLSSIQKTTYREYFGEPAQQRNYWPNEGKINLIRLSIKEGANDSRNEPEWEAGWAIRRAYPMPEYN